jgi:hypothetical protein
MLVKYLIDTHILRFFSAPKVTKVEPNVNSMGAHRQLSHDGLPMDDGVLVAACCSLGADLPLVLGLIGGRSPHATCISPTKHNHSTYQVI